MMPLGFTGQYVLNKNQTTMDAATEVFQVVWMLFILLFGY